MKVVPNLFRITSIVIFIQLLLGGLLTFNFIDPAVHIITGIIVIALAIATMIVTFRAKDAFRTLRGISIGMVILILIQIILGLETLSTNNSILAWVHFAVAMGIYAMSVTGSVMSSMWERMNGSRAEVERQTTT